MCFVAPQIWNDANDIWSVTNEILVVASQICSVASQICSDASQICGVAPQMCFRRNGFWFVPDWICLLLICVSLVRFNVSADAD